MARRQRGTALSQEGIESVRVVLATRGWTQGRWAMESFVSLSTIKRALRGERLDSASLSAALASLGLCIQGLTIHDSPDIPMSGSFLLPPTPEEPGIFMTATFVRSERARVDRAIRHLRKLLISNTVTVFFNSSNDGVTVTGNFEPHRKKQIEMTIDWFKRENIFTDCEVTF